MRTHRLAIAITLLASTLAAQAEKQDKVEPVKLVSRAEKLLQKKELEEAVLLLWQALDLLATLPSNPVHDSAALSARFLLKENDPREEQRREVFASVAKQQVELAAAYRGKKWLEVSRAPYWAGMTGITFTSLLEIIEHGTTCVTASTGS